VISAGQCKLIHVARRQLQLTEDDYRAILDGYGGVASARDLDHEGFDRVMAYFNQCGFVSTWKKRTFGNRPGMASPGQVDLIRKLWRAWSDNSDQEASLNRWLENKFGISALRFLDPAGASKAITALRAMGARKRDRAPQVPAESV
jgi:hypothetical protein